MRGPLQTLVNEIKEKQGIEIVVNDKNRFAFDNIAYRYLAYLHKMVRDHEHHSSSRTIKVRNLERTREGSNTSRLVCPELRSVGK